MKCAKYALKLETDALQKNEDFPSWGVEPVLFISVGTLCEPVLL